jgi:hypothetical protein
LHFFKTLSTLLAIGTIASLTSCVSVPVAARSSEGEKFVGSATAELTSGHFELVSARGVRCYGTYNQWDPSISLDFKFKCSDGRYGTGTITRDPMGQSGIGIGQANDGTTFDFAMGVATQQIHYEW